MSLDLSILIKANTGKARNELRRLDGSLERFGGQAERAGQRADRAFTSAAQGVRSISRQLAAAKAQLIAFLGVQQGLRLAHKVADVVVEFEKLNAQLKTLTGSKEAARQVFEQIQRFALETPFELTGVTRAWIMLKARGIQPTDEVLRGLGNTASAMGKSLIEVSESALQASVGNLETMRMMGFNVEVLGDKLKVTFDGITETIDKSAAGLIDYFSRIGNTRLAGAMADQMETLGGTLSNVSDNAQKAVKALSDASGLTGAMTRAANATADWLGSLDAGHVVANLSLALEATAVVLAARLTPAVQRNVAQWTAQARATLAAIPAQRKVALAALEAARAEQVRTAALLEEAQAQRRMAAELALYGPQRAAIERQVAAAQAAHAAATDKLVAAEKRYQAVASLSRRIGRGLLGLLGGWPGVIAGAVTAIGLWTASSREAASATRDWKAALLELEHQDKALERYQIDKQIRETQRALEQMRRQLASGPGLLEVLTGDHQARRKLEQDVRDAQRYLNALQRQRQQLAQSPAEPMGNPATAGATSALDDYNQAMKEAKQLYEDTLTPQERYAAQMDHLMDLYGSTNMSLETFNRAAAKYRKELEDATGVTERLKAAQREQDRAMEALLDQYIADEAALEKQYQAKQKYLASLRQELRLSKLSGRELAIQTRLAQAHARGILDQDAAIRKLAGAIYDNRQAQRTLGQEGKQTFHELKQAVEGWGRSFADTLLDANRSFADFADSILRQLARIAIAKATDPLFNAFGNFLDGLFSGNGATALRYGTNAGSQQTAMLAAQDAGLFHGGGQVATEATAIRRVPAALFENAPRHHRGYLAPNERPAILRTDESVLTPGQMRQLAGAGGNVYVTINEDPRRAGQVESRREGGDRFIEVFVARVKGEVAADIARGGTALSGTLERTYGLSRTAGAF